ncbi:hypothetical protein GCM10027176_78230 [Actinoallomurus bryophytorum]|uniref:Histidine kinase n=1 Tax=Actinoallomurus bryophytorum TaxID=1490222 RepID=A0A543CSA2_9ACTN|nr:hypothetical protein [Actinoallomurus bryophytorum]TQL99797.1 hypothetical protein FB559_5498 [Actinoallomurus bryophytorum]
MTTEQDQPADSRYELLKQLGEQERQMTRQLHDLRAEFAHLVTRLLPMHSPRTRIDEVVAASGYSRTLIEALRAGNHPWLR